MQIRFFLLVSCLCQVLNMTEDKCKKAQKILVPETMQKRKKNMFFDHFFTY